MVDEPFIISFEAYIQQEESPYGYILLEEGNGGRILLEESVDVDVMYLEVDTVLSGDPFTSTTGFSGSPYRSTSGFDPNIWDGED